MAYGLCKDGVEEIIERHPIDINKVIRYRCVVEEISLKDIEERIARITESISFIPEPMQLPKDATDDMRVAVDLYNAIAVNPQRNSLEDLQTERIKLQEELDYLTNAII